MILKSINYESKIDNKNFRFNIILNFSNNININGDYINSELVNEHLSKINNIDLITTTIIVNPENYKSFRFILVANFTSFQLNKSLLFILDKLRNIKLLFSNGELKIDLFYGILNEIYPNEFVFYNPLPLFIIINNIVINFSKYEKINTFENFYNLSNILYNYDSYNVKIKYLNLVKTHNLFQIRVTKTHNTTFVLKKDNLTNIQNILLYLMLVCDMDYLKDSIEKQILIGN